MAAKAKKRSSAAKKKSRGPSTSRTRNARGGAKKRPAAKKSVAKKSPATKPAAKKSAAKRPAVKKKSSSRTRSPIARVTRVAREVAQQATAAVTEGVESLKEMGESLVERVTG